MNIGQVIGTLWATRKDERLSGLKLLLVRPVNLLNHEAEAAPIVAADLIGAGVGERVIYVSGSSARGAVNEDLSIPVDASIVGIVDGFDLDERDGAGLPAGNGGSNGD